MNNTTPVLKKILHEEIPVLFQTAATKREDQLWWFDALIYNKICHITKGTNKYSPIHLSIEYIPSKENGSGYQAITKFKEEWFQTELGFKEFKELVEEEADIIFRKTQAKKYNSFQHFIQTKTLNPFAIIQHLVTYQEWNDSRLFFTKFMENKLGFEIEDEIFDHFLDSVPPIIDPNGNYMANGEPFDVITQNQKEVNRYISFHKFQGKWYYSGLKTKNDLKEWSESCSKIENYLKREQIMEAMISGMEAMA